MENGTAKAGNWSPAPHLPAEMNQGPATKIMPLVIIIIAIILSAYARVMRIKGVLR